MPSESRRGLVRIASNYARLIMTAVVSLAVVRIMLTAVGQNGWALIALLGSTVGLSEIPRVLIQVSMIRELGEAHHSGDDNRFKMIYNSALVLSGMVTLLVLLAFAILWIAIPLLAIDAPLIGAARWIVVVRGIEGCIILAFAAPKNMYKVTERMVAHNCWQLSTRFCNLAGAVYVLWILQPSDASLGVAVYATIATALTTLVEIVAPILMMRIDRRLIPAPRLACRKGLGIIVRIGAWNLAVHTVSNLHRRMTAIITNLAVGLAAGSLPLGLAILLTATVRRLVGGVIDGVEAVSTRISTKGEDKDLHDLLYHTTRLQGAVTFPITVILFVLPEPLLDLWLGDSLTQRAGELDVEEVRRTTVTMIRVMLLGFAARAISDGWLRILYGAGHIARYAPLILLGGFANPLISIVLLYVLPEESRFTAACWGYSAALVLVHGIGLPILASRKLEMPFMSVITSMTRPFWISLLCIPLLVVGTHLVDGVWSAVSFMATVGAYGTAYVVFFAWLALTADERRRIMNFAFRRFRRH